jgi:hypothetical protein
MVVGTELGVVGTGKKSWVCCVERCAAQLEVPRCVCSRSSHGRLRHARGQGIELMHCPNGVERLGTWSGSFAEWSRLGLISLIKIFQIIIYFPKYFQNSKFKNAKHHLLHIQKFRNLVWLQNTQNRTHLLFGRTTKSLCILNYKFQNKI